ncbi:MAG: hypothetical protein JXB48_15610 [Candidatus Latescibacteria bacterium]|nr:hypothetical protein [Candidatus Latescibacterota bacterium]
MKKRRDIVIDLLKKAYDRKDILVSGCGTGNTMSDVFKHGYNINGVDINRRLLSVAAFRVQYSTKESEKKIINLI